VITTEGLTPKPTGGDYVRSGLKRGLALEAKLGTNPYKTGMSPTAIRGCRLSRSDDLLVSTRPRQARPVVEAIRNDSSDFKNPLVKAKPMTRLRYRLLPFLLALTTLALAACGKENKVEPVAPDPEAQATPAAPAQPAPELAPKAPAVEEKPPETRDGQPYSPYARPAYPIEVYWGETHLHSANSTDAIGSGNRLGPEETMRFARGEEVISSSGQPARLQRPLDFVVLTDHAEGLGVGVELLKGNPALMDDAAAKRWHDMMVEGGERARQVGVEIPAALASGTLPEVMQDAKVVVPISKTVWAENNAIAERFNEPGRFTTLIGYEWTSVPNGNNLHRNVIFRDGKDKTDQILPFSAMQSEDPEKLWEFLESYEAKTGGRALAIPHNGNLSNGRMFALVDFGGEPLTADYVATRARWEPVYEVTQIKGDGEAHPQLSPNDELAGYGVEGWDNGNLTLQELETPEMRAGEYAREALKQGLRLEAGLGTNPFKFGMVGSTDAHTSLTGIEEDNFWGKMVPYEPSPERAMHVSKELNGVTRYAWQYLAGGRAAVWATENTRESIWDALERKEVYGTTGSRMTVRFFGGWEFEPSDAESRDVAAAGYAKGVPMGSDLTRGPEGGVPSFLVSASRDPLGANLDRVQIVKGWLDSDDKLHEKVYDVAWGDAARRKPAKNGKLPPVGNTVNVDEATYANTIGDPDLTAVWKDPDFDPEERAFYYVRVVEIPTPRWTAYDAKRFGVEMPEEVPMTTTERAYTSPIWYTP